MKLLTLSDKRPALLVAGILLIAINLRAPITAVGPLLANLGEHFSLSAGQAGMLVTLPLLVFSLFSPCVPSLAGKYGLERTLFASLLLIAAGIILRSLGPVLGLYAGTAIIGAGIAIGNVLLPSLLKRDFPLQVAKLTSIYALTMGAMAALASALVIPMADWAGWACSLLSFLLLPLAGVLVWLPLLNRDGASSTVEVANAAAPVQDSGVWRSVLAWQISLFLGINSIVYYVAAAWLPAILVSQGHTPAAAGTLHGLMQMAATFPGLLLVPLVKRLKDQRSLAFAMALLTMSGILGLWWWPGLAALWVVLFGFGSGAVFILGLTFISLRAGSSRQAGALSGMAQCIGYLLAAVGPMAAGALRDGQGDWDTTLILCGLLCLVMALCGLGAGRDRYLCPPISLANRG